MGIGRRLVGGDGVVAAAGDGEGGKVFEQAAAAAGLSNGSGSSSSSALRSPASSGLTDDGGEVTSVRNGGGCSFSSSSEFESESESESESEEAMQLDGDGHGGGPLYELAAPLLAQLPLRCYRTGLSKFYQGKSQSFTSLRNAKCVEDLAKKTTPYITRMKLHRCHGVVADRASNSRHAPGPCCKMMAKKTPRCSSDRFLSRLKSKEHKPLNSSSSFRPPAHQNKKELSRC